MRAIYIISLICLFTSCNSHPRNSIIIQEFPITRYLTGNPVSSLDNELGILAVDVVGDFILCSSHRTDYHFSIYSKENLNKITDLCKKGRGPEEFIAPIYFSQYEMEDGNTKIWILDRGTSKFMKVNINKSIAENNVHIEKLYTLSNLVRTSLRCVFWVNDSCLWGTEDNGFCKNISINTKSEKVNYVSSAFKYEELSVTYNPFYFFQNLSTFNPHTKYAVTSFFNLPQIDFIDSTQKVFKTIFYKEYVNPASIVDAQANEEYFSTICSDDQYVYVLYNRMNSSIQDTQKESSILVFNWDGEPICEYIIPYATYISIDAKTSTIYAVDISKEDNVLTTYFIDKSLFKNI